MTAPAADTIDVKRLKIVPTDRFPNGGWVSDKSQLKCNNCTEDMIRPHHN